MPTSIVFAAQRTKGRAFRNVPVNCPLYIVCLDGWEAVMSHINLSRNYVGEKCTISISVWLSHGQDQLAPSKKIGCGWWYSL